jgi:tetratricopeptide (TPR) repeat protein
MHQFDAAIEKYKALELDKAYALAYYNWGLTLRDQGKFAEAAPKLRRAAKLDPTLTMKSRS